jgi:dTDP-4-dehydrorhamnose reductase
MDSLANHGVGGMLGTDLVTALGTDAVGLDRGALDITDLAAVQAAVAEHRPDVVVNCAAWTEVDAAETAVDAALAVNGIGPANLAAACAPADARLVQVSADYVFDGTGCSAEDDKPRPVNAYGRTKLAGERAVLNALPDGAYVVRTAWTYGAHERSLVKISTRG